MEELAVSAIGERYGAFRIVSPRRMRLTQNLQSLLPISLLSQNLMAHALGNISPSPPQNTRCEKADPPEDRKGDFPGCGFQAGKDDFSLN